MKSLKKVMVAVLVVAMSLAVAGQALAWRGNQGGGYGRETGVYDQGRGYGQGLGDCAGPQVNICEGEAVTISGTVSQVAYQGQGLSIDTGAGVVTVYGIGPYRFWDEAGVDRPEVGDAVVVNAYNVTFSDGTVKTIAASVVVGDEEVILRDAETGAPLWRKGPGLGADAGNNAMILSRGGNGGGKGGNGGSGSGSNGRNDGICPAG